MPGRRGHPRRGEVLLRVPLQGAYSQREPIASGEEVYTRGVNQSREARRFEGASRWLVRRGLGEGIRTVPI
eukprot:1191619-Prorocentrum_minimum.AAC.3